MMKAFLTFLSLILLVSLHGQNVGTTGEEGSPETKVKHQNIIKAGASVRVEAYSHYDLYYEPYYDNSYNGGYHVPVFISYEHIWDFKNKTAIAIEPMMGISFRKHLTGFFAGSEFKFYWANKGFWRMGISLNVAYTYSNTHTSMWISMDDGAYQKLTDITRHYHIFSFDPALVPFQFRIKNSPVVIESLISIMGLNVVTEKTGKYKTGENESTSLSSTDPYPFFLKYELKIGFVLP